jgi:5-methylcytosine-specific restriction enzyme A
MRPHHAAHGARARTALSACEGDMQVRLCNECWGSYEPYRNSRGRCRDCLREYERAKRQRRGSTAQRGYDRAWQELRKVQLARQPYCAECGATDDLTVDHVLPLARAGRSELSNLQTLCRRCNGSKSGRHGRVFAKGTNDPRPRFSRSTLRNAEEG